MQKVYYKDLGQNRQYKEIWDMQETLLQENVMIKSELRNAANIVASTSEVNQTSPVQLQTTNHLLFVEHNPVYTLGKSGEISHVLINEEQRREKGIEFFKINRGGDITFHGPGQLVGYPIIDLDHFKTDLGWYLRCLEEVVIRTLAEYNIKGDRSTGETGVWIEPDVKGRERKICAMGIRCSRWITMHGFALNVNTDLDYFNFIIPCGIQNKRVTSIQQELGYDVSMGEIKEKMKRNFEKVFQVQIVET